MNKWRVLLIGFAMLAVANYSILKREGLLRNGDTVVLELAPVDPRSLMQGDYMALRFAVADEVLTRLREANTLMPTDGFVVLSSNEAGVAGLVRIAPKDEVLDEGERRMRYRLREHTVRFATNAFFFQEGDAAVYAEARFGEFRVDSEGESILVALLDKDQQLLGERLQ